MTSLKRVRRDHTCIFLDFSYEDMCEKCQRFTDRKNGIGRKLQKNMVSNCTKNWFSNVKQYALKMKKRKGNCNNKKIMVAK